MHDPAVLIYSLRKQVVHSPGLMAALCTGAGPAEAAGAWVPGDAGLGEGGYSPYVDGADSYDADPPSRPGASSSGADGA
eukprot:6139370-Alexandrium_andersonii.AAC.1